MIVFKRISLGSCLLVMAGAVYAENDPGRAEAIAALQAQRTPINADNLVASAVQGNVDRVLLLLAAGVDPNQRSSSLPQSALNAATMFGCSARATPEQRERLVDALLAAGADPNATEGAGTSTLTMVSQRCPGETVAKLLAAGGDTDHRSPQGFGPLSMALTVKNWSAAEALINHGTRLPEATLQRLFPEPPEDPQHAALIAKAKGG